MTPITTMVTAAFFASGALKGFDAVADRFDAGQGGAAAGKGAQQQPDVGEADERFAGRGHDRRHETGSGASAEEAKAAHQRR